MNGVEKCKSLSETILLLHWYLSISGPVNTHSFTALLLPEFWGQSCVLSRMLRGHRALWECTIFSLWTRPFFNVILGTRELWEPAWNRLRFHSYCSVLRLKRVKEKRGWTTETMAWKLSDRQGWNGSPLEWSPRAPSGPLPQSMGEVLPAWGRLWWLGPFRCFGLPLFLSPSLPIVSSHLSPYYFLPIFIFFSLSFLSSLLIYQRYHWKLGSMAIPMYEIFRKIQWRESLRSQEPWCLLNTCGTNRHLWVQAILVFHLSFHVHISYLSTTL